MLILPVFICCDFLRLGLNNILQHGNSPGSIIYFKIFPQLLLREYLSRLRIAKIYVNHIQVTMVGVRRHVKRGQPLALAVLLKNNSFQNVAETFF